MDRRTRSRSWWGLGLVLVAVATVAGILLAPRHDAVGRVDAVVVLGGGGGERLSLGRALAVERDVPLVLSAEAIDVGELEGLACGLEVVCLQPVPVTTAGEAATVAELAGSRGWERIAVATSSYHVNRARMLFRQCFGPRVDVVGAAADGALATDLHRYTREFVGRIAGATIRRAC